VNASVSGRADDLALHCSSDTFDLNGCAFESSENWAVLSTEGDKPVARFDVIKSSKYVSEKCKLKCHPHLISVRLFFLYQYQIVMISIFNSMQQPW
jgi:hypothetical protein